MLKKDTLKKSEIANYYKKPNEIFRFLVDIYNNEGIEELIKYIKWFKIALYNKNDIYLLIKLCNDIIKNAHEAYLIKKLLDEINYIIEIDNQVMEYKKEIKDITKKLLVYDFLIYIENAAKNNYFDNDEVLECLLGANSTIIMSILNNQTKDFFTSEDKNEKLDKLVYLIMEEQVLLMIQTLWFYYDAKINIEKDNIIISAYDSKKDLDQMIAASSYEVSVNNKFLMNMLKYCTPKENSNKFELISEYIDKVKDVDYERFFDNYFCLGDYSQLFSDIKLEKYINSYLEIQKYCNDFLKTTNSELISLTKEEYYEIIKHKELSHEQNMVLFNFFIFNYNNKYSRDIRDTPIIIMDNKYVLCPFITMTTFLHEAIYSNLNHNKAKEMKKKGIIQENKIIDVLTDIGIPAKELKRKGKEQVDCCFIIDDYLYFVESKNIANPKGHNKYESFLDEVNIAAKQLERNSQYFINNRNMITLENFENKKQYHIKKIIITNVYFGNYLEQYDTHLLDFSEFRGFFESITPQLIIAGKNEIENIEIDKYSHYYLAEKNSKNFNNFLDVLPAIDIYKTQRKKLVNNILSHHNIYVELNSIPLVVSEHEVDAVNSVNQALVTKNIFKKLKEE